MDDDEERVTIAVTKQEITTILAALEHWQDSVRETDHDGVVTQDIPFNLELTFLLEPPLSRAAIHELWKRLHAARS